MRTLPLLFCCMSFIPILVLGQTNEWSTQYVTFDDAVSGTGWNTPSVAVVGEDDFVALIARVQNSEDIFGGFNGNYLVGYMDADSANGRVVDQPYGSLAQDQFEIWSSGLDQVILSGAWQIAGGSNNYVYVANNDVNHNILVFELTPLSVASTDFRMETGTTESIFAIDVDTSGYVYVVDYEGTDAKDNEVKVVCTDWDFRHDLGRLRGPYGRPCCNHRPSAGDLPRRGGEWGWFAGVRKFHQR